MKPEILVPVALAVAGGCFALSVKYPKVCIDVFETLSRAVLQVLLATLFVTIGHAATRYVMSSKFSTVFDGRIYSTNPADKEANSFAEHADFAVSRLQSAIGAANDTLLQWLALIGGIAAGVLLLFTSCTYLAKKIMEHGYSSPSAPKAPGTDSSGDALYLPAGSKNE